MLTAPANPDRDWEDLSKSAQHMRLAEPGEHSVDVPVTCVITRFALRSARYLLPMYLDYRRVARDAVHTPGLLQSAFLIENLTTCYSVSIWSNYDVIPYFGTYVLSHVEAARRAFGRVRYCKDRGPEIWSTKWRLATVSNNLNWKGLDLRELIVGIRN